MKLHHVEISDQGNGRCTVTVDGHELTVTGYRVERKVESLMTVTVTLIAEVVELEGDFRSISAEGQLRGGSIPDRRPLK